MKANKGISEIKLLWNTSILLGTVTAIWSIAAFFSALAHVDWQFAELVRQYLIAIGVMQEFHTAVDFYTHIKGVEYIICVLFLTAFPAFYVFVNNDKAAESVTM